MTELWFPSSNNNINEKNKSSEFTNICSFILSHPLYFSYLIFFSPYLFKLISFLSPLFFTTFLLFLSLLTTLIPLHSILNSKDGFFLTTYATLTENFRPGFDNDDDDNNNLLAMDEFEVYKVVFDVPTIELIEANPFEFDRVGENPGENFCELEDRAVKNQSESLTIELIEANPVEDERFGENPVEKERFEENPVENERFGENPDEKFYEFEEKTVDQSESLTIEPETGDTNPKKVEGGEKKQEETVKSKGSKVNEVKKAPKIGSLRVNSGEKSTVTFPKTVNEQQSLVGFGSMRKEKEWRRTLACKLFEERHNWSSKNMNPTGNSEEGMDLLWETEETEKNRGNLKEKEGKNSSSKKLKRKDDKMEDLMKNENCDDDDQSEESDDYEIGKVCCLQALKLSAGKMNLSMGRPNLVKFSKAFKGFGWLHSHVRKQGKKGCK